MKNQRIDELVTILNGASEAYYNGLEEQMSNYEWDALFDELTSLELETGYIRLDSPTQNAGFEEVKGQKEQHEYPALSLAKTKQVSELVKWADGRDVWVSPKCDGCTIVVTADNGKVEKLLTRGDGTTGTNITFLKDAIKGIPDVIDYKGHLVVRGEATISYSDFNRLNATIEDEDDRYANPRNLVAGTLNLDDVNEVKNRSVTFNAFTLVHVDDDIKSWGERMDFVEKLGFNTVKRELTTPLLIQDTIDRWTKMVEDGTIDIPVDGLVICYEDNDYSKTGSVTGHHATRAGFAFKWQDESIDTELEYVEWSCAMSTISPVAVFKPVQLEGTIVKRASLCNISEMERLGIGDKGSIVTCIKSNKIIPKIIAVPKTVGKMEIPCECPVCRAATEIKISENSGTKRLVCTNSDCPAKHLQKYTRFVSKQGMNIEGLSVETILKFVNAGYIREFNDIYHLSNYFDEIKQMEGFGEKSCENISKSIENSRKIHPVNLIFALCIPLIGLDAGKKFVNSIGFDEFIRRGLASEGFTDIDGIGEERSNSIIEWFSDKKNCEMLEKLLAEIEVEKIIPVNKESGRCKDITFVITGDVHIFKNRDEFKTYVEQEGGSVTGSVSKKTNYLVNNDVNSTSSKNKKAMDLGIPIISEEEFISRFKN